MRPRWLTRPLPPLLLVALQVPLSGCPIIPLGDWEAVEALDQDGDGWLPDDSGDCDDSNSAIHPEQEETCGDGVVNGCTDLQTAADWCYAPGWLYIYDLEPALVGSEARGEVGVDLVSAGDLSGDGTPVLAVLGAEPTAVYVVPAVFGQTTTLGEVGSVISASPTLDVEQLSLAGPGDLDGDGVDDLLVAELDTDDSGAVHIVEGPLADGESALNDFSSYLSNSSSTPGAGAGVASGDYDDDGSADLLIAAPGGGHGDGKVYLISGPLTGSASLQSSYSAVLSGSPDSELGASVAQRGDADGDGVDDLLLGAPGASQEGVPLGAAWLESGPVEGSGTMEDAELLILGSCYGCALGAQVAFGGDGDGDGLDDLVVVDGDSGSSSLYVYLFSDLRFPRSPLLDGGDAYATITGSASLLVYDPPDLSADVNDDGYDDLLVTLAPEDLADSDGEAAVFYGPLESYVYDVTNANALFERGDALGASASWTPDLNDDGLPDIAVGAPRYDDTARDVGGVFLFAGGFY